MNPKEIFLISRVFSVKADKYPKVTISCERACEFLKPLVCDFGKIGTEIQPVLAKKFKFPNFEPAPSFTEGYQNMSLGETDHPKLGVIFKKAQDGIKYFIPVTAMHRLTKKQLDTTLASVQRSNYTTEEVKFKITRSIHLLSEVRKFW